MRARLSLLGLVLAAQGATAADAPPSPPPGPTPLLVITRAATPAPSGDTLLPGTVEATQETAIHARTNGYVKRWHAEIGDRVKAGQLLVEIDAPEVDQALAASRAALAQAEANLDIAQLQFERWKKLVAKKTVPEYELDEREATFKARRADVVAARANLQRYQELAQFKQVTAPYAGTITQRMVETGALIDAGSGSHPLYRLAQTAKLRIRVGVPQARLREIVVGMPAQVLVAEFPGKRFDAKVTRTARAVEPASRTLLTEVELDNADDTLMPGLYAQVAFQLPTAPGTVLIPTNAVRFDRKGAHLATVDETHHIHLLTIELGRNLGTQFEVVNGLAASAPVVLNPTDLLQEGTLVEVKEPAAPKR
jgi:RND family efflux transporter MFP subunit